MGALGLENTRNHRPVPPCPPTTALLPHHQSAASPRCYRPLPLVAADEDSWSDGEQDPITVDQTWRGDPDSEADSIDSDQEDPLK